MEALVSPRICDVCGRRVHGECDRHPWADLLDPKDPDDAAYIAGRKSLSVSKFTGALQGGAAVGTWVGVMAVWPAFMLAPEVGVVVLIGTLSCALVAAVTWFVGLFSEG
ncbi:MAG: hypothetical protein GY913_01135 [Proteobacteria bacterium]|nr:hypothetical protein [Pseudomonadota bacterium]MCP4915502.1 hypothetical protein [Pseudomonadota bacterium]